MNRFNYNLIQATLVFRHSSQGAAKKAGPLLPNSLTWEQCHFIDVDRNENVYGNVCNYSITLLLYDHSESVIRENCVPGHSERAWWTSSPG